MGLLMLNGHAYAGFTEPAEIYSAEEREIGVWIDGKPLYQKTINMGTFQTTSSETLTQNIPTNCEKIVSFKGFLTNTDNTRQRPLPFSDSTTNNNIRVDRNDTSIRVIVYGDWKNYAAYLTISYTKTTDTAGSGRWSNTGDQTHHYSTSEQVIGTWIDGKPVYEKTITGTTIVGGQSTYINHNIQNLDTLVDCNIITHFSDNDFWRQLNFAYNNGDTSHTWLGGYALTSTQIIFQIGTSYAAYLDKWHATIRYTKTTD